MGKAIFPTHWYCMPRAANVSRNVTRQQSMERLELARPHELTGVPSVRPSCRRLLAGPDRTADGRHRKRRNRSRSLPRRSITHGEGKRTIGTLRLAAGSHSGFDPVELLHRVCCDCDLIVSSCSCVDLLQRRIALIGARTSASPSIRSVFARRRRREVIIDALHEGGSNLTLPGSGPLSTPKWDLNPVENIWQFVRDNWLSNRVFFSHDDILDRCCDAWNKLVDQPWTIMSIGLRDWAHRF
jgi:hypothetical protein